LAPERPPQAVPGPVMDFTGRLVLVTGASSGIGRETAILLAGMGGRLILAGRRRPALEAVSAELCGSGHRIESFDLNDADLIPDWLRQVATEEGPLDGLVHSAGIHAMTPLRVVTSADFESLFRVNAIAGAALAKGFRQRNVCTGFKSIVFVSSVLALVGQPATSAYSAAKGALNALARSLAAELARERIRVNAVAAGLVDTAMTRKLRDGLPAPQWAAIEAMHPLGIGAPVDVARAIVFLLGDGARWITGTELIVDGGYTAL